MTPAMWLASIVLWTVVVLYAVSFVLRGEAWAVASAVILVGLFLGLRWVDRRRTR